MQRKELYFCLTDLFNFMNFLHVEKKRCLSHSFSTYKSCMALISIVSSICSPVLSFEFVGGSTSWIFVQLFLCCPLVTGTVQANDTSANVFRVSSQLCFVYVLCMFRVSLSFARHFFRSLSFEFLL